MTHDAIIKNPYIKPTDVCYLTFLLNFSSENTYHISCFGINNALDVIMPVSLFSKSMPIVNPI